jgi:hypothetical protein
MDTKWLVVLAACIDPSSGSAKVVRSEPAVRLRDYKAGLRFWLKLQDQRSQRLLFIENSGYSLDVLRDIAETDNPLGKTCEFLSLTSNEFPAGVHYGYGELSMLDDALDKSRLMSETQYMIKANGRLTFPAISRLLDHLPPEFDFAIDCRNNSLFEKYPRIFATTQLMIFALEFYRKHILGLKEELLDHRFDTIERLLYEHLMRFRGQPGAILRWPVNCAPRGQAAHWEKSYDAWRQRVISGGRGVARIVVPNWWV